MAGRIATARFESVDGAFDQLSMPQNSRKMVLILLAKIVQDLPLAAGESGGSHGAILALHFTCCSHKAYRSTTTLFITGPVGKVQRKVNGAGIIFLEGRTRRAPWPSLCPSWLSTEQPGTDAMDKTTSRRKILKAADDAILPPTVQAMASASGKPVNRRPNYLCLLTP